MTSLSSDQFLTSLPAHLFRLDDEARILGCRANPVADGHPLPDKEGAQIETLFPVEIAEQFRNTIRRLSRDSAPIHFDYTLNKRYYQAQAWRQGDDFIFMVMPTSRASAAGRPNALEFLTTLLDTVPVALYWKDLDSNYLGCNLRFANDAGYTKPAQLVGKNDFAMSWAENAEQYRGEDQQIIDSGEPIFNLERTLTGNAGAPRILSVSKFPLRDKDNRIIGILGVHEDVTDKKRSKEEKRSLYEQIRKTQKMEAVARLTSGIAHDFNNILASILGYADLTMESLRDMGDQPELLRYITEVIDEAEKARDLITQMLAFARINRSDDIALNPVPLIKEIAKATQASLPDNIELYIYAEEDIPKVMIDPSILHQAVQNLCANSREALREKGGHISVNVSHINCHEMKCHSCHDSFDGDYVEVSIADDGEGIPAQILEKIFDPFFSNTSNMGLESIHRTLHEQHGHIIVDSIPKYGTTIRLLLPTESQLARSKPATAQSHGELRILIVEGDVSIARLQSELLQSKGFITEVFSDAFQALENFKADPYKYDCIVIDEKMPSFSGVEFSSQAQQLHPEIPVIICTSEVKPKSVQQTANQELILKPFTPKALIKKILKLTKQQQ